MSAERLCPAARAVSRADRRHAPLQSQRGFTLPPAKASWAMALPTRGWLHRRPAAAGPWCAQSGTCRLPAPRHAGRLRADRCEARSGPSFLRLLPSARRRTRWIRAGCGCDRRVRGSGRRRFRQVSFSSVSSSCGGYTGPREQLVPCDCKSRALPTLRMQKSESSENSVMLRTGAFRPWTARTVKRQATRRRMVDTDTVDAESTTLVASSA